MYNQILNILQSATSFTVLSLLSLPIIHYRVREERRKNNNNVVHKVSDLDLFTLVLHSNNMYVIHP